MRVQSNQFHGQLVSRFELEAPEPHHSTFCNLMVGELSERLLLPSVQRSVLCTNSGFCNFVIGVKSFANHFSNFWGESLVLSIKQMLLHRRHFGDRKPSVASNGFDV